MSVAEDRMAEITAAFGEFTHYVENIKAAHAHELETLKAGVADAQKKLEDVVASSIPHDSFVTFADSLLAAIKGAMA